MTKSPTNRKKNPRKKAADAKSAGVGAVDRALAILSRVQSGPAPLTLAQLAAGTGLYKSTILRHLASLIRCGFVRQQSDGRYVIGPEPLRMASNFRDSFRIDDAVAPILASLVRESGETASFFVRDGDFRVCLFSVEPERDVHFFVRTGDRFSLDRGSSGKILRAFEAGSDPILAEVRKRLWASSFGERDPESASVSVPVFGLRQELKGALVLSGPRERFTRETVQRCVSLLLPAASELTKQFNGDAAVYAQQIKSSQKTGDLR
jgi:DNA-binding IclR family transcriptional regulator